MLMANLTMFCFLLATITMLLSEAIMLDYNQSYPPVGDTPPLLFSWLARWLSIIAYNDL